MSDVPPGSAFEVFDNDENQFIEERCATHAEAMALAQDRLACGHSCSSFTIYERHETFKMEGR